MIPFTIIVDTREKITLPWPDGIVLERATMGEGDLTTPKLQGRAVVERKSVVDWAASISHHRERFDDELRRLRAYERKCIVVEGNIADTWTIARGLHPNSVYGTVASFTARAECPVIFAGNASGAARVIAGILRRWEDELCREQSAVDAELSGEQALDAASVQVRMTRSISR